MSLSNLFLPRLLNKVKKDNSVIPLIHGVSSAEEQMAIELQINEDLEEDADKEDQHALARAYAQVEELKNAIKKKKTARFNGVEVLVHHQRLALAVPASANMPVPPIPVSNSAPANPTSSLEAPIAGKTPVAPNLTDLWKPQPSTNSAPQFHYQSSFDEAAATKWIINQVLDTKMEISTKDLLAVSLEIRKQVRELAATKKITIRSLETASDTTPSLPGHLMSSTGSETQKGSV
ncbi:hypothetical protein M404DRAFT_30725 [Pisolithus tinctorius Marx 270]|uniref:Uncharacterized protein n=1 Tax=Pisolithus tinctorius Marx 270 TaxID=870435 RepID=A0A0C3NDC3_PISTI|nr:hypothetical protein M404DRAFT_30725 [Pisolithus tinctorius Marx 270]